MRYAHVIYFCVLEGSYPNLTLTLTLNNPNPNPNVINCCVLEGGQGYSCTRNWCTSICRSECSSEILCWSPFCRRHAFHWLESHCEAIRGRHIWATPHSASAQTRSSLSLSIIVSVALLRACEYAFLCQLLHFFHQVWLSTFTTSALAMGTSSSHALSSLRNAAGQNKIC